MLHSFLAQMRRDDLDPWLDHEGWIHLSHWPDSAYLDYLKRNKPLTLIEFDIEERVGVALDSL